MSIHLASPTQDILGLKTLTGVNRSSWYLAQVKIRSKILRWEMENEDSQF